MFRNSLLRTFCLAVLLAQPGFDQSPSFSVPDGGGRTFPFPEELAYRVEWRMITAGTATLNLTSAPDHTWKTTLNIQSAGVVSRLYRVLDSYQMITDPKFCLLRSELEAQENKRHVKVRIWLEGSPKLRYEEKDLISNSTVTKELDTPPCTREIAGALASLRLFNLQPGQSTTIPVTDGKKVANARIESQARESLSFDGKKYETIRYEAFLFNNVLYHRKGRLFVWLTDDQERIPVQIRLQLGFPIGNIIIQLDKEQRIPG